MYQENYSVKEEHIDCQGIMDGLYYPFYMEWCRHNFAKKVLGFDLELEASKGVNLVLAEYTFKFKSSLKKGDQIVVTCDAQSIEGSKTKFAFIQKIILNEKTSAEATFIATALPAAGGRPFIPQSVLDYLAAKVIS